MEIRIRKLGGGRARLTLVRDDGSHTAGELSGGRDFGALHDLAHYVVETQLGFARGFYGLLAAGWQIPDFEVKGTAATLEDEAIAVECIVGQLTNAVVAAAPSPADFAWLVREAIRGVRPTAPGPEISATDYGEMLVRVRELLARWRALGEGEALSLPYPAGRARPG